MDARGDKVEDNTIKRNVPRKEGTYKKYNE